MGGGEEVEPDETPTPHQHLPNHHHHNHHRQPPPPPTHFSLAWRLRLCLAMLALESYISFEEIFMLPVLQRVEVPVLLVSLPGTISSAIGVFVIPLLGWASDRRTCCTNHCGQKRPFVLWTAAVCLVGAGLIIFVSWTSLYEYKNNRDNWATPSSDRSSNSIAASTLLAHLTTASYSSDDDKRDGAFHSSTSGGMVDATTRTFSEAYDLQTSNSTTAELTSLPTASAATMSDASFYPQSTQTDNSSAGGDVPSGHAGAGYLTIMGAVGILGFVLADHGYDSSMSTLKAYMVAVAPASQHDDIFILGTLIGAVGGCLTSLLGFVDLASLFPSGGEGRVLDEGMAQCLVQAFVLFTKLLLLCSLSVMTGSESGRHHSTEEGIAPLHHHITHTMDQSETVIDQCDGRHVGEESDAANNTTPRMKNPQRDDGFHLNEKLLLVAKPSRDSCCPGLARFWRRRKRRVLLCVMTFLGLIVNYSYFVYVSNYVAQVIYLGDPDAESGSQAYDDYVNGVHIASLGMLTFYCLFVVYNLFHHKVLAWIGMRGEYLVASVVCAVLMATLAITDSLVVFFINAVGMAMFRAAVYTVPFILSNNLAKQEAKEMNDNPVHSSGVAMATISAMIPGSYFLVSLIMGPLMDVTGYPGMPIIVAAIACVLGIVSTAFVHFG